jgi:RNA polymerase subunit RPABC4/transcription elongation factor Spt4
MKMKECPRCDISVEENATVCPNPKCKWDKLGKFLSLPYEKQAEFKKKLKMKKCPVCEFPVEENTTVCPRCGWEFKRFLNMTEEDKIEYKAKLLKARKAYQAKTSKAVVPQQAKTTSKKVVRPKEVEADPRLSENLPYYDFILIGHSSVGKTTYLTMLGEQGGDKNSTWNFRNGGSALDLGNNAPKYIRERVTTDKALKKNDN